MITQLTHPQQIQTQAGQKLQACHRQAASSQAGPARARAFLARITNLLSPPDRPPFRLKGGDAAGD